MVVEARFARGGVQRAQRRRHVARQADGNHEVVHRVERIQAAERARQRGNHVREPVRDCTASARLLYVFVKADQIGVVDERTDVLFESLIGRARIQYRLQNAHVAADNAPRFDAELVQ